MARAAALALACDQATGCIGRRARRAGPAGLAAVLLAGLLLLGGCAADKPKPTPLSAVSPQISVQSAWRQSVGAVTFPLGVAVAGKLAVVAGETGSVMAFDARTGEVAWRGQVGQPLSAGVGSDGRFAAVVTRNNELVVLDQGAERWRAPLKSRVTTTPLVAGERVFVMGVDRVVQAFDAVDGRRLWTVQRPGEALTLAQPGLLTTFGNTLVAGVGATMLGIEPTRGAVRWEVPLTSPRGTNEVERLNDLVGPAVRLGDVLCTRAFQTAVGCIDASRGQLRWSRTVGGYNPVAGNEAVLVGADGADRITAWRTATGDLAWTNERLLYRALSAPASFGRSLVFGDFEGQLHFLARDDGQALLRLPTDGSAVVAAPVVIDGTLLVVTRQGGVFGFRGS